MASFFKKIFTTGIILLSVAVFAAAEQTPAADGQNEMNSILASVNGEPVSLGDVLPSTRAREYQAFAAYSGKRFTEAIRAIRKKAVDDLIEKKLILADYKSQSYKISARDIEYELDKVAERMGCRSREDLRQKLFENNMTIEQLRREVEDGMIVQFMLFRKLVVAGTPTPKEMYEYFVKNEKKLEGEELVDLAMLKLDKSRADWAIEHKEISDILARSPERFSELVRRYAPEFGDGRLGEIERAKLRPEFSAVISDFTPGKIYGPLELDGSAVWLRILSHKVPEKVKFEDVAEKIRSAIEADMRQKALQEYISELRAKALIEYFF